MTPSENPIPCRITSRGHLRRARCATARDPLGSVIAEKAFAGKVVAEWREICQFGNLYENDGAIQATRVLVLPILALILVKCNITVCGLFHQSGVQCVASSIR